ncbi:unnamed protein product [Moneuplotes crassus]|uniref:CMP/dCMP-type deaminase domain-containing protein n=1 Tax=Euplotes crassus TaxID=5936 RepID=A0AAD2D4L3_EUPCR|nr:unnamed protein product [Moneuplotes crassus]
MEQKYLDLALEEAVLSLENGETPVGCVFVYKPLDKIIAKSGNLTNQTCNATTHCEINCITKISREILKQERTEEFEEIYQCQLDQMEDAKEATTKQVLMKIFEHCELYVTIEPCIMCAHALAISGIKTVYFGGANSKFGGNGSIYNIHKQKRFPYTSTGGEYLAKESVELLQKFYERGNENIPEKKRHRKAKSRSKTPT